MEFKRNKTKPKERKKKSNLESLPVTYLLTYTLTYLLTIRIKFNKGSFSVEVCVSKGSLSSDTSDY